MTILHSAHRPPEAATDPAAGTVPDGSTRVRWTSSGNHFASLQHFHLPTGVQLPEDEHARRHHLILRVLVGLMPVLCFVGWVGHIPIKNVLVDIGVAVAIPTLVAVRARNRRFRSSVASFALMAAAATLVNLWHGQTAAHFLFFVLLPLVALYQDWLPFLVALAVVTGHHAIMGTLFPREIYDSAEAQGSPVLWALIHGAFIVALIGVLIVYWNAAEVGQRALATSVAELRNTQLHLVHAQKLEAVGVLAAGVAHEINTPIQFVGDNLGFLQTSFGDLEVLLDLLHQVRDVAEANGAPADLIAQLAAEEDARDLAYLLEEIPAALAQSQDGILRVAEIVRALTGISHSGTTPASADINTLVRNTIIVTRNEWKHACAVRTELDPRLPEIMCFAGPISQVFVNMIINSVHAIKARYLDASLEQGELVISTSHTEDSVTISFQDNGTGIPTNVRSRVFDPFFTTKPLGEGTGQGLAISYSVVVNQHAGALDVTSEVGDGACFTVRLPTQAVATASAGSGNPR